MIELRILTTDDWPLWRQVRLAALAEAPHAFGSRLADWQGAGDRPERWRARLELPGRHLVAVYDGQPAGMASGLAGEQAETAELVSMWVSPQARGSGVGDQLVEAIVDWATTTGARTLRLAVRPGNQAAIALYRRHGFHATGELGDLLPDGVLREQVMVRPLTK